MVGIVVLAVVSAACRPAATVPAPPPTRTAVGGGEATVAPMVGEQLETELAPFVAAELGLRGVAPAEWVEAEPGHFMPADPADWDTRLVHEFFPGLTLQELVESLLLPVLELEEWPTPVSGHPSARLPWSLYAIELTQRSLSGSFADLALAEIDAGTYLVALLAPKNQRDTLRHSIFLPALDAMEPVPVEDSNRYVQDSLALFEYDRTPPLDIEESGSWSRSGLTVTDLTYASPKGGRVPATVIVPDGPGPFAGIILMHGMPGKRQHMTPLGERYAKAGAVVVTIDAPHARPEHLERTNEPIAYTSQDREEQIQLIVDLRRAVDLLLARSLEQVSEAACGVLAVVGLWLWAALRTPEAPSVVRRPPGIRHEMPPPQPLTVEEPPQPVAPIEVKEGPKSPATDVAPKKQPRAPRRDVRSAPAPKPEPEEIEEEPEEESADPIAIADYRQLGEAYEREGMLEEALEAYQVAAAEEDSPMATIAVARVRDKMGDTVSAIEMYAEAAFSDFDAILEEEGSET